MTLVGIHQPNYLPWLGYFHKIARSDVFVFLDDVQFSKNSYTNRVKILRNGEGRWLTQPVSVRLGDPIREVRLARSDWVSAHLDTLKGAYGRAPAFRSVWPDIRTLYGNLPDDNLAAINQALVEQLCSFLGIPAHFRRSSEFEMDDASGDDRLVQLVAAIAPGGSYLSGKGGTGYQDPRKFAAAGLQLSYTDFHHPIYDQGTEPFVAGLSVVDAIFHLGWDGTADRLRRH